MNAISQDISEFLQDINKMDYRLSRDRGNEED
jgi:hypothetical protein